MRIIHDIEGPARIGVQITLPPRYVRHTRQCQVSTTISVAPHASGLIPAETVRIEGEGLFVVQALRDAVKKIENAAAKLVEAGDLSGDWDKPFEENGALPDTDVYTQAE